jgi:catechol 2,3-dioxygenase-like lactoylglutathione lyase family enzyme
VGELAVAGAHAGTLLRLREVSLRALYLERDGVRIELLHYDVPGHEGDGSPRAMNRLGLTHLSLRVDDLDAALGRLEACGGRVLRETRIEPQPGTRVAFATDPDGTLVELLEQPGG